MLFSEPKIPQFPNSRARITAASVSVLFSEPKIPQSSLDEPQPAVRPRFSALQRAENSSIVRQSLAVEQFRAVFQCSSASRKFLNRNKSRRAVDRSVVSVLFSEPKIPQSSSRRCPARREDLFQCSSASRKFLNRRFRQSAARRSAVSVLFSEPKIPQSNATVPDTPR